MRHSPLAWLAIVSAPLLVGCDHVTDNGDRVSISGKVTCFDGSPVTAGSVSVYEGRPYSNCLLPCEPSGAPLRALNAVGSDGRFNISFPVQGGDSEDNLWILAGADGQLCGAGYNFVSKALGPVTGGSEIHDMALVIEPFMTVM